MNEIREAEKVFNKKPELFSGEDDLSLRNNLCWYSLEKYIAMKEQKDKAAEGAYKEAKSRFESLKDYLDRSDVDAPSNSFDTASWFCYHSYLKTDKQDTGGQHWLDEAKRYCKDVLERKSATTLTVTSGDLQRDHIRTIMATRDR